MNSTLEARSFGSIGFHAEPIRALLAGKLVLEVCVNPDGSLWVNSLGKGFKKVGKVAAADAALLLLGIATVRDLNLNGRSPILETISPLTVDRIEGLVPPTVTAPAFANRTRQKRLYALQDMVHLGILTEKADTLNQKRHRDDFLNRALGLSPVEFLRLATKYRRNLLLVGQGPTHRHRVKVFNALEVRLVAHEMGKLRAGARPSITRPTPLQGCLARPHKSCVRRTIRFLKGHLEDFAFAFGTCVLSSPSAILLVSRQPKTIKRRFYFA